MRKVAVLFSIVSALAGPAVAQQPAGMIAYDYCQSDYLWQTVFCDLYLVAVDGSKWASAGDGVDPAWSPDGSRIAFVGYNEPGMFVLNLGDWSVTRLPFSGQSPAWSPDGLKLAFSADGLYVIGVDGSNVIQLTHSVGFVGQPAWSPDGHTIAFDCEIEPGNRDICAVQADGTGLVRLTTDPAWDSSPAFSPDGSKMAFATTPSFANPRIVVMNADGTGITQVGPDGVQPAWSPDGTRIAFVVPFEGACEADGRICPDSIYIINADGTDPQAFTNGNHPAWALSARPVAWFLSHGCNGLVCAFDGSGSWGGDGAIVSYTWNFGDGTTDFGPAVTHAYSSSGTYTITLTVRDAAGAMGTQSRSVDVVGNLWPTASFTSACSGSQCTFDGSGSSDSDGSIASYTWYFSDGASAAGSTVSHRYTTVGTFTVTLYVTDNGGATGQQQQTVTITVVTNAPPVASFTSACTGLTCSFNASGSSDPDGNIASYAWNFGDGMTGSGTYVSHTYLARGTYPVMLSVTDNAGATSTHAQNVTAVPPPLPMHVGDVDGASTLGQNLWTATVTITVHDGGHAAVSNAVVTGFWNDGANATCTTNANGQCAVIRSGIPRKTPSVGFSIANVTHATLVYKSADNHDPDGDSSGGAITVIRR